MTADLRELIKKTINTHRIRCPKCSAWMVPCAGCTADAVLPVAVESIAAGFDSLADAAKTVDREHRDVDVVLAWYSGARFVRTHAAGRPSASVEPQTSPGGTPGNPCPSRIAHESGGGIRCRQTGSHIVHTNMAEGPNRVAWVSGDDREHLPATSPTGDPTP